VGAAAAFAWDTADHEAGAGLVSAVEAELGDVDVLVCNTGGPPLYTDSLEAPTEAWLDAYKSLVLAPMELVRAAVPGMRDRGWGRVLNVVSSSAREPIPGLILSSSHRAAALATWKTLATEVAADGVTVNSVLPGRIDTDRLRETMDDPDRMAAEVPARRLGRVEEMAAAAAFLCSDRAGYITGAALLVDGGLTKAI
jgi:3-oxoacyl-[acyl-carrier protein] reductase